MEDYLGEKAGYWLRIRAAMLKAHVHSAAELEERLGVPTPHYVTTPHYVADPDHGIGWAVREEKTRKVLCVCGTKEQADIVVSALNFPRE